MPSLAQGRIEHSMAPKLSGAWRRPYWGGGPHLPGRPRGAVSALALPMGAVDGPIQWAQLAGYPTRAGWQRRLQLGCGHFGGRRGLNCRTPIMTFLDALRSRRPFLSHPPARRLAPLILGGRCDVWGAHQRGLAGLPRKITRPHGYIRCMSTHVVCSL
jgi:hypothetical protein